MSRKFGKLLCSIWSDDDFLDLSDQAKVLYASFISSPDISPAGVLSLTERRWRRYVKGGVAAVSDALTELEEARFVVVDDDTAEVWVRAFVKVDDRLSNGNLRASVFRALGVIHSQRLRSLASDTVESIRPGQRASEGPSTRTGEGIAEGDRDGCVHEHASSNLEQEPETSKQQAATPEAVIREAARIFTVHRSFSVTPRNPAGFLNHTMAEELALKGDAARQFLSEHPHATARELVNGVWGLTKGQIDQVLHHDEVAS